VTSLVCKGWIALRVEWVSVLNGRGLLCMSRAAVYEEWLWDVDICERERLRDVLVVSTLQWLCHAACSVPAAASQLQITSALLAWVVSEAM
jgi:hypothetical protein